MSVDRERYLYQAMMEGEMPDPPVGVMRIVRELDGWREHLAIMVRLVHAAANNRLDEEDYENAGVYADAVALGPRQARALCKAAMSLAKQDPMYWGVEDPEVERFCTVCREPHPIEEFAEGSYVCKEESDG